MSTVGDAGFTPRLAAKWTWSRDSLSIAFSIDPRARWHDGKPVRATDVRFTYRHAVDPKAASPIASQITNVDSVSVADSLTAVVWFKHRMPEQFYDFVYQLAIMPEHVYGRLPAAELRTSEVARHPVGSGRFRLVRWEPGARLEMIADTANYRGRPKLDRVVVSILPNVAAAAPQVLAGDLDFIESFPGDQVAKLDSSTVAHAVAVPMNGYSYMAMNRYDRKDHKRPHQIFSDIAVRRALSMAVDRSAMLQNVFGKNGRIGHGPFPNSIGSADTTLRVPPFDLAHARALLDSAGWKEPTPGATRVKNGTPLRFSLMVPTSSAPRLRYGVLLQSQFKQVGAEVELENVDVNATFVPRQNNGDFDAELASSNTDPSVGGAKQFWSSDAVAPKGLNFLRYSNPRFDAQLDSAIAAFDPVKAQQYASRAYQTVIDDVPAIWLYDVMLTAGSNRRIVMSPFHADGWWTGLDEWWIPRNARIDRDRIGLTTASR
jgi:peptide/nickel transport system substrate-binding protein